MTHRDPVQAGGIGRLYAVLWRHAEGERLRLASFLSLLFAAQLVRLSIPYFFGQSVNALQTAGAQDVVSAGWYTAAMFGACIVGWMLHGPGRILERSTALTIREKFADAIYAQAIALPLRWHEQNHSGETIQRIDKAREALSGFAQHQFIYLQNLVSLVGPLIALLAISWITGGAAVAGYALIGFILVKFDARMLLLIADENQAMRRYHAEMVDCLGNIATVLTLRLQAATRTSIGRRLAEVSAPLRRNIVVNEAKWCAIDLLNNGLRTGLVVLYAWLSWREQGLILVGTAVMVHQYAQQVGSVVGSMATHWQDLMRQKADIASADPILDGARAESSVAAPNTDWQRIAVRDLRFHHAARRSLAPALDGIDLDLARGKRIALIGESGSGKSTLLRVLAGLYDAESVRISVDGLAQPNMRDLGQAALLVPQDPEVFEGSLLQNITMGIDYDDGEIARACRLAELAPVLGRLPNGMETHISERGLNLSGGQKQRLALARGILAARGHGILMLDEPTSSIDPLTESRIYDSLLAEFPNACVISAVHRLHLLDRFDEVVLMADGKVVDAGTVAELHRRQPSFRQMRMRAAAEELPEAG